MNTPTPEQLQEFKDFCNKYSSSIEPDNTFDAEEMVVLYDMFTAYANHVLTKHEGFQSNAELKRKLAALQEQNTNLLGKLATTEQNLAISQEKVDYWVEHWNLRDVEATNLQQQLTDARKEIEGLKAKLPIECDHNWVSSVAYKGARVCSKCHKYQ